MVNFFANNSKITKKIKDHENLGKKNYWKYVNEQKNQQKNQDEVTPR
jgi:hypothetical protein